MALELSASMAASSVGTEGLEQSVAVSSDNIAAIVEAALKEGKVIVQFQAVGSSPELKQKKFKLSAAAPFQHVHEFLRKQLRSLPSDSLFLYLNRAFAPSPDALVRDLYACFHDRGKLLVFYCATPAWG